MMDLGSEGRRAHHYGPNSRSSLLMTQKPQDAEDAGRRNCMTQKMQETTDRETAYGSSLEFTRLGRHLVN